MDRRASPLVGWHSTILHGNISFELIEQSREITAMINTVSVLHRKARDSSEETIAAAVKPSKASLRGLDEPG